MDIKFKILSECKKKFIQRQLPESFIGEISDVENKLKRILEVDVIDDLFYAESVLFWLKNQDFYAQELEIAKRYARYMVDLDDFTKSTLFRIPKKVVPKSLFEIYREPVYFGELYGTNIVSSKEFYEREGFKLSCDPFSTKEAVDNANYCIFCHERCKDSCRKGFVDTISSKKSGCPLDQKISEMNYLKSIGYNIAALTVITLDNPMCAATGYRICNDCMKSCIFQKQEPVNIPGIETNILDSVLGLPYGFEIYSLLTKWNPLALSETPKDFTGCSVLISGMGPGGFTIAHYLINDGHTVICIDGNKIEPLPIDVVGISMSGERSNFLPIKYVKDIFESLEDRTISGFGGVLEYGITVRWNKNYLKLIQIMLERRENFRMYGGVNFGGNVNVKVFYELKMHHLILSTGTGSPNIPDIKNFLARGVRFASDFLMSLQLGGAFKKDSITNLQLRMPIIVIGAGLTAIDVAAEALEYYKIQVEKLYERYLALLSFYGEEYLNKLFDDESKEIISEFLLHAKELRVAKNKIQFLKQIGGVKIIYYKNFEESSAYQKNHEEVREALKQGVEFLENITPIEFICDEYGALENIRVINNQSNEYLIYARSAIIAIGNSTDRSTAVDIKNEMVDGDVTLVGDVDPDYSGSVVSAMLSAKAKYKHVSEKLIQNKFYNNSINTYPSHKTFFDEVHHLFRAKVLEIKEIARSTIEVVVYAPLAAQGFEPGQFYKLQNYESSCARLSNNSTKMKDVNLLMEPLALTGASVDKDSGTISLIVFEYGASSKICKYLEVDEYVSLMGPVGSKTEIKCNENVLLIGGGLGNAVLFSIGAKMRSNGCKVTYIAGYRTADSIFKVSDVEFASDFLIWACEEKLNMKIRENDRVFHGNVVEALIHNLDRISLREIDRILVIGSDKMMCAVRQLLLFELKNYIKCGSSVIASINSPMQCMMSGLCAQCMQIHNTNDGAQRFIYSCKDQDQSLFTVDFKCLSDRLRQNYLLEIITNLWVEFCSLCP